jgi:uncharacterized protein YnzC (UPF0291/DUF896 family)
MNPYKRIRKDIEQGNDPRGTEFQVIGVKKVITDPSINAIAVTAKEEGLTRKEITKRFGLSEWNANMVRAVVGSGIDISLLKAIAPSPEDVKPKKEQSARRLVYIMDCFSVSEITEVKPSYSLSEAFEIASRLATKALKFHNPDIGRLSYQVLADQKVQTLEER